MVGRDAWKSIAESWTRRGFSESLCTWTTHRPLYLSELVPTFVRYLMIQPPRWLPLHGRSLRPKILKTSREIAPSSSSLTALRQAGRDVRWSVGGKSSTKCILLVPGLSSLTKLRRRWSWSSSREAVWTERKEGIGKYLTFAPSVTHTDFHMIRQSVKGPSHLRDVFAVDANTIPRADQ